ncbi:undecaprenyl-phosphate glucose phosphotransferase [Olivibacter ginsenosidimutans]|uniref:Undecaprenyl-phosphate glucose phosphotransferase n=1 Tax=Olivibacter ginsenosidimutans TaxID=1176537 RepID=A0ABP9AV96_9SPHI
MIAKSNNVFYVIHFVADMVLVCLAFFLAAYISQTPLFKTQSWIDAGFLFFLLAVWYFSTRSYGLYKVQTQITLVRELFNTLNCLVIQVVAAILFIFVVKEVNFSRFFVLAYGVLLALSLPLVKLIVKRLLVYLYSKGILCKRAIVIGDGVTGRKFYRYMQQHKMLGYQMIKYINGKIIVRANGSAIKKINSVAIGKGKIGQIDEVFIAEADSGAYDVETITNILTGYAARLRVVPKTPKVGELPSKELGYKMSMLGNYPLLSVRREPLEDVYNQWLKRSFDIVFSLLILTCVCSWLFPLLAICIKLGSKGPVFFRQERWGRRNKPFICFKFRSMYTAQCDTDNSGRFLQAKKGDARITPIGRVLRKTNLDEFPQFVNVLLGHMSIVGPRPHASLMNIESVETIERYLVRHMAKPGITGWAQVNGLRGESSDPKLLEARVAHDVWYIEHWSFWLDLRIIFLTVINMVVGDKQAY